jgi:hypothetical protein
LHDSTPYTKLPSGSTGTEEAAKEESESQFTFSEIPQVTVRTTHYIQVDFNPDTRRPMPIPRKTFTTSGGGTPTSLVPKPRRVNYTHVDIHATNKLADHLQRQMTVREAEQKVLATKQYVNIDHSGTVDDDTDPDYYTHMRDFTFEGDDEPDLDVNTFQQQDQAQDNIHTFKEEAHDSTT